MSFFFFHANSLQLILLYVLLFCDITKSHYNLYKAYYSKYAPSATHSVLHAGHAAHCAVQLSLTSARWQPAQLWHQEHSWHWAQSIQSASVIISQYLYSEKVNITSFQRGQSSRLLRKRRKEEEAKQEKHRWIGVCWKSMHNMLLTSLIGAEGGKSIMLVDDLLKLVCIAGWQSKHC